MDKTIWISLGTADTDGHTSNVTPRSWPSFDAFGQWLIAAKTTRKNEAFFSPGLQPSDPPPGAATNRAKETGYYAAVVGLDFDGAEKRGEPDANVGAYLQALRDAGRAYVALTSWSHPKCEAGRNRFRIVFPLETPAPDHRVYSEHLKWCVAEAQAHGLTPDPSPCSINSCFFYGRGDSARHWGECRPGAPVPAAARLVVEPEPAATWTDGPRPGYVHLSDEEIVRRIVEETAPAGPKYEARLLWAGELLADPGTRSEGDYQLAQSLSFWTGGDCGRVLSLMLQSPRAELLRDRWTDSYLRRTVRRGVGAATSYHGMHKVEAQRLEVAAQPGGPPRFGLHELSDAGSAERFVDAYGGAYRYVSGIGWHEWEGRRWQYRPEPPHWPFVAIGRELKRQGLTLGNKAGMEMAAWGQRSTQTSQVNAALTAARRHPKLLVTADQLDANAWLLNTPSGTVDLRTGVLHPHAPTDLITKVAGAYDPDAPCARFELFLDEIFGGDKALAAHALRYIGYSLTADVSEQCIAFAHGGGANGKSTLLNVLRQAFDEYCIECPPDLLIEKRGGGGHPTDRADLRGARLVLCEETPEGKSFNEALLKQLTGGTRVKARFMRENFFEFDPTWKIVLASNYRPHVRGQDHAFWRRMMMWPFERRFPKNPEVPKQLAAEAPGILALFVRACIAWQRDGLAVPDAVREATENYREEQDQIAAFLAEKCEVGSEFTCRRSALYREYKMWAMDAGIRDGFTKQAFNAAMTAREWATQGSGGRTEWIGLRVEPPSAINAAEMPTVSKIGAQ